MVSKRCGCASDSCACVVTGGTGVTVSGAGTKSLPYVVDAEFAPSSLAVEDENTVVRSGVTLLDFKGAGVTATTGGDGEVIVTVPGATSSGGINGVSASMQVFSTPGGNTWTKPANLLYVVVEVVGGGGGSGGTAATGASENSAGAGGGAGGYARKIILDAALGATVTATVGAGGAAGTSGTGTGGTGGTSSFGATVSATGGTGGSPGTAASTNIVIVPGVGGTGTGDLVIPGGTGFQGQVISGVRLVNGNGGDSHMGSGGSARSNAVGDPGSNYGGGGGGSTNSNSQSGKTGAAGAPGVVIVTSYVKT